MIEGLEHLLENSGQPGLPELRELIEQLLGGHGASHLIETQTLQTRGQRVFRLRFASGDKRHSVIIKRLKPEIAQRNALVAQRWLPAIGLDQAGPPLLGSVAARNEPCVWHVYQDLGCWELNQHEPKRDQVEAAIQLIAQVHLGFAQHALLGEVRLHGGDLGMPFYEANVRDAIYALEAWRTPEQPELRDRLLERLHRLRAEGPERLQALEEAGAQETLLHGDLWAINVFVIPEGGNWRARLIDWDHAAVGPASYDLSTFLMRFGAQHRSWVFELYKQAVSRGGWRLPGVEQLNGIFETHEYARFANRIIWPAIALQVDGGQWGIAELIEIEKWFKELEPVFPIGSVAVPA